MSIGSDIDEFELFDSDSPDKKYMDTLGSVPVPPGAGAGAGAGGPIAESRTLPERLYFHGGEHHYYLEVSDHGYYGGGKLLTLYMPSKKKNNIISKNVKHVFKDGHHAIEYGDKGEEHVIKILPCQKSKILRHKKYPQCLKYGLPDLDWFNTVSDWFVESGVKIDDSKEAKEGINASMENLSGEMQGSTLKREFENRENIAKLTGRFRGLGGVGLSIGGKRKRTRKNKGSKKRRKTQKGGKKHRKTQKGKGRKSRKIHSKKSQKKTLKQ